MALERGRGPPIPEADRDANGNPEFSMPRALDLLACSRRWHVVDVLAECGGTANLDELATKVAARENDKSAETVRSKERKRVYVALYQNHLPRMDRDGVVEYDGDRGLADRDAEHFETVRAVQRRVRGDADPHGRRRDGSLVRAASRIEAAVRQLRARV